MLSGQQGPQPVVVGEYFHPSGKFQVCRNHSVCPFSPFRNHLKKQFGFLLCEVSITKFINEQQVCTCNNLFHFARLVIVMRFTQFRGQRSRSFEKNIIAKPIGRRTKGRHQMRLAGAGIPNHYQVLIPADEITANQLLHIFWFHMLQSAQVELLQRLQNREVCPFYTALPLFFLSGIVFFFHEAENKFFQAFTGFVLGFFLTEIAECRQFL